VLRKSGHFTCYEHIISLLWQEYCRVEASLPGKKFKMRMIANLRFERRSIWKRALV
jgi:hypothetical protein